MELCTWGSSAVESAGFVREIFVENVVECLKNIKFSGEIEIDESPFGKKQKYRAGKKTNQVWTFGLMERSSNRLILLQ